MDDIEEEEAQSRELISGPTGFLALSERTNMRQNSGSSYVNPGAGIHHQYTLLRYIFPTFPTKMLDLLLFTQHLGNSLRTFNVLSEYGWTPVKGSSGVIAQLTNQPSEHFTVPYYWGVQKPRYITHLRKRGKPGHFITTSPTFRSDTPDILYTLSYIDSDGIVRERSIGTPQVPSIVMKHLKLTSYHNRPDDVTVRDLLPFLSTSSCNTP
jgi:hypothetical protein